MKVQPGRHLKRHGNGATGLRERVPGEKISASAGARTSWAASAAASCDSECLCVRDVRRGCLVYLLHSVQLKCTSKCTLRVHCT